jgi:hypothetical protein
MIFPRHRTVEGEGKTVLRNAVNNLPSDACHIPENRKCRIIICPYRESNYDSSDHPDTSRPV